MNKIFEVIKNKLGVAKDKIAEGKARINIGAIHYRHKQILAASVIAMVIIAIVTVMLVQSKSNSNGTKKGRGFLPAEEEKIYTKDIESATSSLDPEKLWHFQTKKETEELANAINDIKGKLESELKNNQSSQIQNSIASLESKFIALEQTINENKKNAEITEAGIQRVQINLSNNKQEPIKTVDNTIPAGAFAKAILLSGTDASTSISASSDPSPLLIRLTDPGTLPRKFKGDLDDCHIIASGYGDISSERMNIRLEKLTCIEVLTGEIIETQVAGYVAGEDGKSGLRGKVIAKETAYLANSLVGGIVGGFSSTLTPQNYVTPFSGSGLVSGPSNTEKFQSGFGNGMSSSMDRLSKYYIDRAEMLQPVIEISAGRIVDVIFTEDSEIGSSNVKKEISVKRDQARMEAAKKAAKEDKYLTKE